VHVWLWLAFERGLVIEPAGPDDDVLKLLPPLTIDDVGLAAGLDILEESLRQALSEVPGAELPALAL
jgi:diaminobutyrate-2-oxoglutarate transaminase